jgi:colanic acid/amylovoran biosynthesis glycosyltransferase
MIEKKGWVTSFRAFAEFVQTYPKAQFYAAGDGPLRKDLEKLAQQLNIERQVHFLGFISAAEMKKQFAEAHIFLHPSEMGRDGNCEGVPNAMLEAMATGLPVVATNHGGIPEAVQVNKNGWLVPERDPKALASTLLAVAGESKEVLSRVGREAAATVQEFFNQTEQVAILEGHYKEAMHRPGSKAHKEQVRPASEEFVATVSGSLR